MRQSKTQQQEKKDDVVEIADRSEDATLFSSVGSPQNIFEVEELSALEKRNKKIFIAGIVIVVFYVAMTLGVYIIYLNMDQLFAPR